MSQKSGKHSRSDWSVLADLGRFAILLSAVSLSACVPALVPAQSLDKVGIEAVLVASGLPVLSADEAASMESLGPLTGYSCRNKSFDPPATRIGALDQVKILAVQQGATAITAVECKEGGLSMTKNCWSYWECEAIALR